MFKSNMTYDPFPQSTPLHPETKKIGGGMIGMQVTPLTANDLMNSPNAGDWEMGRDLAIDASHINRGNPKLD